VDASAADRPGHRASAVVPARQTGWSYSNTNYIVVGLILQRVTHRPVSRLIEQRIVRPLRLRHTYLAERSTDIAGITLTVTCPRR
jgi:CubicO group peptidase (beta-lactamase class C family)